MIECWTPARDLSELNVRSLQMRSSTALDHSLSIIVPTLNEEENVEPLVSQIAACSVPFREILFVDDHSTDGTRDRIRALAERYSIRLIEQDRR